jgi:WD40 repeat protein
LKLVCKNWYQWIKEDLVWKYKTLSRWKKIKKAPQLSPNVENSQHLKKSSENEKSNFISSWQSLYHKLEEHDSIWFDSANKLTSKSLLSAPKGLKSRLLAMSPGLSSSSSSIGSSSSSLTSSSQSGSNFQSSSANKNKFSHKKHIQSIAMNAQFIASAGDDKVIKLWDRENSLGNKLGKLSGKKSHSSPIHSLNFHPFESTKLLSGSLDKTVKIWDVKTKKCLSSLELHSDGVLSVSWNRNFSEVSHLFASGSVDKSVRIFDTQQMKPLIHFSDHEGAVNCVYFLGNLVASASEDSTIKIFDIRSGNCIKTFVGHKAGVSTLQFDIENGTLISGGQGKIFF